MVTRVRKWGNSLGLRIPRAFAEEVAVKEGSTVDLSVSEGCLVIRPATEARYVLAELLAEVTEANLHGEVETGPPSGREVW